MSTEDLEALWAQTEPTDAASAPPASSEDLEALWHSAAPMDVEIGEGTDVTPPALGLDIGEPQQLSSHVGMGEVPKDVDPRYDTAPPVPLQNRQPPEEPGMLDKFHAWKEKEIVPRVQTGANAIVAGVRTPTPSSMQALRATPATAGTSAVPQTTGSPDVAELLARRGLQPLAGEEWANRMEPGAALRATNELGAASVPLQALAYTAGVAPGVIWDPLKFLGAAGKALGIAREVAPAATTILGQAWQVGTRIAKATAAGIVLGAGSSVTKEGERTEEGAKVGGLLGGGLHGAVEGVGAFTRGVSRKMVVAELSPEASRRLAEELHEDALFQHIDERRARIEADEDAFYAAEAKNQKKVPASSAKPVTKTDMRYAGKGEKTDPGSFPALTPVPRARLGSADFKPSIVSIGEKDGQLVAMFVDASVKRELGPQTPRASLVIQGNDDVLKYRQLLKKHGIEPSQVLMTEAAEAIAPQMPPRMFQDMFHDAVTTPHYISEGYEAPLVDLDAMPAGTPHPPQAVIVNEHGTVSMRATADEVAKTHVVENTDVVGNTHVNDVRTDTHLLPEDVRRMTGMDVPRGGAGRKVTPPTDEEAFAKTIIEHAHGRAKNAYVGVENPDLYPKMPPDEPPGRIPGYTHEDIDQMAQLAKKMAVGEKEQDSNVFVRAWKKFLPDQIKSGRELGARIAELRATRNLLATGQEEVKRFMKLLPDKKLQSQFDHDFKAYAEGRRSSEQMKEAYPQVWDKFEKQVHGQLRETELLSETLAELGMVPQDLIRLRRLGMTDKYIARMYKAHIYGDQWLKHMPAETWREAVEGILATHQKRGTTWTEGQVAAEVANIVRAENPMQAFAKSKLGAPWKNLLHRNDKLPPFIKNLLGEEMSGAITVGMTLGKQRALVAQGTLWREIAQKPEWFSQVKTDKFTEHVPNNRRLYGAAAGGYVLPDFAEVLHAASHVDNPMPWWQMFGGAVKAHQVPLNSLRQWWNASINNVFYSAAVGGLNWYKPVQGGQDFKAAWAALTHSTETHGAGLGDLVLEAKRFGVDLHGQVAVEILGDKGVAARELGKLVLGKNSGDLYSIVRRSGDWVTRNSKRALTAYDLIDRTYKLANYIALKRKFLGRGMPPVEASREAAWRINKFFPNPQNPNKVAQAVRNTPFGFMAPYATYATEDARIMGHVAASFKDDPAAVARLASLGIVAYGVFGNYGLNGFIRRANGISDEEVQAATLERKKNQQAWRPLLTAMPWKEDVFDESGKKVGRAPAFWDLTPWIGPGRLLSGHPDNGIVRNVLLNFLKLPVEGGLAGTAADASLEALGLAKAVPGFQRQPAPGESFPESAAHFAVDHGAVPGIFREGREVLRKTDADVPTWLKGGVRGRYEEKLSIPGAAQKLLGAPYAGQVSVPGISQGEQPSWRGRLREIDGELKKMEAQRANIIRSRFPQAEKEAQVDALMQRRTQLMEERNQLHNAVGQVPAE